MYLHEPAILITNDQNRLIMLHPQPPPLSPHPLGLFNPRKSVIITFHLKMFLNEI